MLEVNARKMVDSALPADALPRDASFARSVLEQASAPAWSPIVVAGVVRMVEFLLILLVGSAIYTVYLYPVEDLQWHYVAALFGIALAAMLAFQAADVYQVQAFRGYEKQYFRLASAWSVVFLLAMSVTFLAKLGDYYSRVWLGTFFVVGLLCLIAFRRLLFLLVRRWTREGRLDRRTVGADERGEALIRSLADIDRGAAAAVQRGVQGQSVARRPAAACGACQGRGSSLRRGRRWLLARHRVKPGITGWAQISGWRGEPDTHEKIQRCVEHDLYYIENWSVVFDLFILAKTPFALAKTENAF
jgi:hypothetical protein